MSLASGSAVGSIRRRVAILMTLLVAAAVAGCSSTPSSPTPATSPTIVGTLTQEPPPVPPRLDGSNGVLPPTGALGATRFLAFGDSITFGIQSSFDGAFLFAAASGAYPERLLTALRAYHPAQSFAVPNEGVSGETASTGAMRMQGTLDSNRPQAVLLLEGINDMNNGASVTRAASSVIQMVQIARLHNSTVFVALMFQTYESVGPDGQMRTNSSTRIAPFNNELRRLAAGIPNVHVVDLYASFGSNRSFVGGDGLHPTPAGYERMASTFLDSIEAVYPVRGSLQ